ncbi:MAG: NTP transferase domain-containing protein [Thermoplasmata archaeon]|nr:NTP transferase domain-containing protein [Thermoplasmata archaeon]MCK5397613.1 NTP transferase domain-containing protein [Thermoplasmata archaeon]
MVKQAVILCGGLGTRLRPLTYDIPKPMIPFGEKPFLEILVDYFKAQGIERFVFCTGHLHEHIEKHFGNGSQFGVEIIYSVELEPLGTGGALLNAKHLLDEQFFFAFGDSYLPLELRHLIRIQKENNAQGVITIYMNNDNIAPNNIRIMPDGRILNYIKKNPPDSMNGLEAGLSLFNRDMLDYAPGRIFSLEEAIFPKLINTGLLFGLLTSKRFYDIGTPNGLELARREINDTD